MWVRVLESVAQGVVGIASGSRSVDIDKAGSETTTLLSLDERGGKLIVGDDKPASPDSSGVKLADEGVVVAGQGWLLVIIQTKR